MYLNLTQKLDLKLLHTLSQRHYVDEVLEVYVSNLNVSNYRDITLQKSNSDGQRAAYLYMGTYEGCSKIIVTNRLFSFLSDEFW